MESLTIHHYGFLTYNTGAWLAENELLFGKPCMVFETVKISSQKVNITFVQQSEGRVFTELIEPWEDNAKLQKMIAKGITVYHTGYLAATGQFDKILLSFNEMGIHTLAPFASEAFEGRRCVFVVTGNIGMIEIIEQ
jgi:Glyoxalase/Bleomycin resistance protein/Dioxygenase superfamily